MPKDSKMALADAAALGAVAGMRGMLPLAVLSLSAGRGPRRARRLRRRLTSTRLRLPLLVAAGSELIYDKLPSARSRLSPPLLAVRLGTGATAGALVCATLGEPKLLGALAGAVAALGSALLFHRLRARVARAKVPGAVGGVAEDALAFGLSSAVRRTLSA